MNSPIWIPKRVKKLASQIRRRFSRRQVSTASRCEQQGRGQSIVIVGGVSTATFAGVLSAMEPEGKVSSPPSSESADEALSNKLCCKILETDPQHALAATTPAQRESSEDGKAVGVKVKQTAKWSSETKAEKRRQILANYRMVEQSLASLDQIQSYAQLRLLYSSVLELDIEDSTSLEKIKQAFRALSIVAHPDTAARGLPPEDRETVIEDARLAFIALSVSRDSLMAINDQLTVDDEISLQSPASVDLFTVLKNMLFSSKQIATDWQDVVKSCQDLSKSADQLDFKLRSVHQGMDQIHQATASLSNELEEFRVRMAAYH